MAAIGDLEVLIALCKQRYDPGTCPVISNEASLLKGVLVRGSFDEETRGNPEVSAGGIRRAGHVELLQGTVKLSGFDPQRDKLWVMWYAVARSGLESLADPAERVEALWPISPSAAMAS